jgi:hypothetical protein
MIKQVPSAVDECSGLAIQTVRAILIVTGIEAQLRSQHANADMTAEPGEQGVFHDLNGYSLR